jgi:putative FmdB family regulatory protein
MPLFEYKCDVCGILETKLERKKIEDGYKCNCKKGTMKPIISKVSNPQFKGKGFYQTDYK